MLNRRQLLTLISFATMAILPATWAYEDEQEQVCYSDDPTSQVCEHEGANFTSPDCSYVRLDRLGRFDSAGVYSLDLDADTMSQVPAGYQSDLGVCYAYAAAQLADAWRISHRTPFASKRISPLVAVLDAGLVHNRLPFFGFDLGIRSLSDVEEGHTEDMIDTLREEGFCPESQTMGSGPDIDEVFVARRLATGFDEYVDWKRRNHRLVGDAGSFGALLNYDQPEAQQRYARSILADLRSIRVPEAELPSLELTARLLVGTNKARFVRDMLAHRCGGRRVRADIPSARTYGDEDTPYRKFVDRIDKLLDKRVPQPIGVSYCPNVLTKGGNYYGLPDCAGHISVLVGRRYNPAKDRCEYLVQNTWGESCGLYHSDWECEKGKIWVERSALTVNTYGLTWLE